MGWDEANERMKELRVVYRTTKNVENVEIDQGATPNHEKCIRNSCANRKFPMIFPTNSI